jgi:HAD superfamily phosphoserine phosphatase-like hydrolase
LRSEQADFVKARFSRRAGRVTLLTARPLLRTFFPEFAHLDQPLGGIIASRRALLRRIRFENDFGVDIGLLLDVAALGAVVAEVDIGHVEHVSRPLEGLADMAGQVTRTLLARAARHGRLKIDQVREAEDAECKTQSDFPAVVRNLGAIHRVALFDMDGTLLQGRYISALARRTDNTAALAQYLDNFDLTPEERTRKVAAVFAGIPREVFEETARGVSLTDGAAETVVELRKMGYRVGIVTDGFHVAADIVRRRVFADFAIGHLLTFSRGKATGEATLSRAMLHPHGCAQHAYCKRNVMEHLLEAFALKPDQVLAVGDGDNDACLLRAAGTSFAIQPKSAAVRASVDHVLGGSLTGIVGALARRGSSIPA